MILEVSDLVAENIDLGCNSLKLNGPCKSRGGVPGNGHGRPSEVFHFGLVPPEARGPVLIRRSAGGPLSETYGGPFIIFPEIAPGNAASSVENTVIIVAI